MYSKIRLLKQEYIATQYVLHTMQNISSVIDDFDIGRLWAQNLILVRRKLSHQVIAIM